MFNSVRPLRSAPAELKNCLSYGGQGEISEDSFFLKKSSKAYIE